MKVVKAVTLLALLAAVSACGSSGPDINARRLPSTLDLDRLAGMQIPGTPRCGFELRSRTFVGRAWGGEGTAGQDLGFSCRGVPQGGNVRTVDGKALRANPEELRCRTDIKSGAVECFVRHERLLVGTFAHCGDDAPYCLDAVDDGPVDRAGSRMAKIGLRCGSSATGMVAIADAGVEAIPVPAAGIVDDIVVCSRGARQSDCYLRHGNLQLGTAVDCPGGCGRGATPSALMALVAQLLATLP